MLFTYLLSLNKTRLNLLGNDNISNTSEILYNERVEVFRTLLLNEILYPDLPKAVVSYHNISRAYYIHIPATKDSKEKETYTHNIEQGFICANVFTTLPVKTRVSKISPIGIIAITAFALMMSFVLSAPSVVSMKVLSGVKRLLNWVRKRDREEQT
jgi:hypothetical protein